ncbi:MAG: glycosyltransferase family 4 protein [Opitutales bacterium]|nr:glycosyltransferase family 4 protein [Opitutales bacterium]
MKILFLTHYYTPEGNAPASRVSALAERWAKDGHDVTILTCAPNVPNGVVYEDYKNKFSQTEVINGVKVVRVWTYIAANKGTLRRIMNFVSYMIMAFMRGLFMKRPDILIATSPQFFCGWAGVLLHSIKRIPFCLEVRDIWPESIIAVGAKLPSGLLTIISVMEKIMYNSADHIVTVGQGYVEKLKERGIDENKISVVMNGVDRTLFYPRERNEELLKKHSLDGKFICSYIGTIGMACALDTALESAEILQNQGNDKIKIVLIGDGAVREELEAKAKAKNLKNVVFLGRRPKQEIPDWIASSDINLVHLKKTGLFQTVMPSKIFESAGCARPVLMGVDGFSRDLVENAKMGISIEPENAKAMADALLEASENLELLKQLGENGYKNIAEKYDRDIQAENYLDILKDLMNS